MKKPLLGEGAALHAYTDFSALPLWTRLMDLIAGHAEPAKAHGCLNHKAVWQGLHTHGKMALS